MHIDSVGSRWRLCIPLKEDRSIEFLLHNNSVGIGRLKTSILIGKKEDQFSFCCIPQFWTTKAISTSRVQIEDEGFHS